MYKFEIFENFGDELKKILEEHEVEISFALFQTFAFNHNGNKNHILFNIVNQYVHASMLSTRIIFKNIKK